MIQKTRKTKETDIDKLIKKHEMSDESEWLSIHEWQTVETDEVMWIFEIRGMYTDYKPPQIKEGNFHQFIKQKKINK